VGSALDSRWAAKDNDCLAWMLTEELWVGRW